MKKIVLMWMSCLFLFSTILLGHALGSEVDLNPAFKSYQNNDFETSKKLIEDALQNQPSNSYLIYNLGLAEYKLGKPGLAIGLWRKALFINPQLSNALSAIDYALSQMPEKPLTPTTTSSWEWIHGLITKNLSFNILWPLCLIVSFFFLRLLFIYLGQRRRALVEDGPTPHVTVSLIALCFCSVLLSIVSTLSFIELIQTKATVIVKSMAAKTGPDAENATLFEVPEGTDLVVRDNNGDWYKIEDPSGRAGWVSKSEIFITTEKLL